MHRVAIVLTAVLLGLWPNAAAFADDPPSPDELRAWIQALGGREREPVRAAFDRLVEAGPAALEALQEALRASDDRELHRRLSHTIKVIGEAAESRRARAATDPDLDDRLAMAESLPQDMGLALPDPAEPLLRSLEVPPSYLDLYHNSAQGPAPLTSERDLEALLQTLVDSIRSEQRAAREELDAAYHQALARAIEAHAPTARATPSADDGRRLEALRQAKARAQEALNAAAREHRRRMANLDHYEQVYAVHVFENQPGLVGRLDQPGVTRDQARERAAANYADRRERESSRWTSERVGLEEALREASEELATEEGRQRTQTNTAGTDRQALLEKLARYEAEYDRRLTALAAAAEEKAERAASALWRAFSAAQRVRTRSEPERQRAAQDLRSAFSELDALLDGDEAGESLRAARAVYRWNRDRADDTINAIDERVETILSERDQRPQFQKDHQELAAERRRAVDEWVRYLTPEERRRRAAQLREQIAQMDRDRETFARVAEGYEELIEDLKQSIDDQTDVVAATLLLETASERLLLLTGVAGLARAAATRTAAPVLRWVAAEIGQGLAIELAQRKWGSAEAKEDLAHIEALLDNSLTELHQRGEPSALNNVRRDNLAYELARLEGR